MFSQHRPQLRWITAGLLLAAWSLPLLAQDESPAPTPEAGAGQTAQPGVSLAALLDEALDASPELLAARARVDAAMRRPAQAASLPDPVLSFTARNVGFPELTIGDEMMSLVGVRFTQAIPAAGKRPAREKVARQQVEVAIAAVEDARRMLIRDVASLYYRIGFVDEAIALVDDTHLLLQEIERAAQARYAVGESLQQDVLKAQVEMSQLLTRRVALAQERDSLVAELNSRLGRRSSALLAEVRPIDAPALPTDVEGLQEEAALASARLQVIDGRIQEQQSSVELSRVDNKPDLTVGGGWMYRGSLPSIWEVNVGIALPIRKSQRQQPETDAGLDELRARRQERIDASRGIAAEVRDAWLRADRSRELVGMYEDLILPQALLSLESTMSSYRVGQVDFLSVLDAVGKLLTFRTELERERSALLSGLADLERHVGRSLGATPERFWSREFSGSSAAPAAAAAPGGSK